MKNVKNNPINHSSYYYKYVSVVLFFLILMLGLGCSSTVKQFYPDKYYTEDNIYENRALRFLLVFSGNWHIYTNPEEMDKSSRSFAYALNKRGAELLFTGATVEGLYGTRGIAIHLNEPAKEYADQVRFLNKNDIEDDSGIVDFFAGTYPMVKWTYSRSGFRFAEFFFNAGTYDIRIAFWTKKESFERFLPVFESIMSTISFTHGL